MDDKGYAFTPLTLLLIVPVIILAVSFGNIINEVNNLAALAIGGDVTSSVGTNIVRAIQDDVADSGRNGAYNATRKVIDDYNLTHTDPPYFPPGTSKKYIIDNKILPALNSNLTSTCRQLEIQTGRNITLRPSTSNKDIPIDPNGNSPETIFQESDIQIVQSDPFGFNVTVSSVNIQVTQNNQSLSFSTPQQNIYVSIIGLEDPYIWVETKARISSVIYEYPYYDPNNVNDPYDFALNISPGKLNYLNECLKGKNLTESEARPYYFPDPNGLSFFDRLEGGKVDTSEPNASRMSTFIIDDPLKEEHGNVATSCIDHEYFSGIGGTYITTANTVTGDVSQVTDPRGAPFYLSPAYMNFFKLLDNYNYAG